MISDQWSVASPLGGRGSCRAEDRWIVVTELVLGGPGRLPREGEAPAEPK